MYTARPAGIGSHEGFPLGKWLWLPLLLAAIASGVLLVRGNPAIVSVTARDDQPAHLLTEQPYVLHMTKEHHAFLSLHLIYSPGQNGTFIIEPDNLIGSQDHCIAHVWAQPADSKDVVPDAQQSLIQKPICRAQAVDLGPYLQAGDNWLTLEITAPDNETDMYVNPQLFGASTLSTLGCLGFFAIEAILVFLLATNIGLGGIVAGIAVAAMLYDALWLHLRPNLTYTNDLPGHIAYSMYMAKSWLANPYGYVGDEDFHPPVYYFLSGRVFHLFSAAGIITPLLALRLWGLVLYMTFCLFGLRTLKEATEQRGIPYYTGSLLIAFWPIGINLATNINSDIASYAVWGAMFYYLMRFFREGRLRWLQVAVAVTGLAFTIKSSAIVPAGILGVCGLYALIIRRLRWQQLLEPKSLLAIGAVLLGMLSNTGRILYRALALHQNVVNQYFGVSRGDVHPFHYYIHFSLRDYLHYPYVTFFKEPGFWNYFLKTMLYGEPPWQNPPFFPALPVVLNLLLVLLLGITACGMLLVLIWRRPRFCEGVPYILGVVVSALGSVGFMLVERYQFCQNFRYVLPMLVPLAVLFVYGMETAASRRTALPLCWAGILISIGLTAGSVVLFMMQF